VSDETLTVSCMNAMKQMTDQELCWIIKYGTNSLHDRLRYLKKKREEREEGEEE